MFNTMLFSNRIWANRLVFLCIEVSLFICLASLICASLSRSVFVCICLYLSVCLAIGAGGDVLQIH